MQNNEQAQWEKLARLLSGNATEEERAARAEGEASGQAKEVWEKTAPKGAWEPNTDKAWQRFKVKALAREQHLAQEPVADTSPVHPLRPEEANPRLSLRWWTAAAAAMLLLLVGMWAIRMSNESAELITVTTLAGQQQEVTLPDGSRVWLNERTVLSYAPSFSIDDREVLLQGEAFFEVKKAEGKRFTILAEGTITEVIGTSFNLKAYAGEPVAVQVVTGRVAFADAEKEEAIFLGPGEEALLKVAEGKSAAPAVIERKEIEDPNFRAWQSKELYFANTSLEQLSQTLSDYYGTSIQLADPALRNCRFTAQFANAPLEEVLEVLRLTGNFSIRKTPTGYVISGAGCQ